MSSEAAYFPDSLASAPDTLGPGHLAHDAFPDILDEAQTIGNETEERTPACVIQTPELSDNLLLEQIQEGDKARTWSRVFRAGHTGKGTAAKTGDTQKPFGCVFYTKDKSPIVYGPISTSRLASSGPASFRRRDAEEQTVFMP
jgi:hypothetical protein